MRSPRIFDEEPRVFGLGPKVVLKKGLAMINSERGLAGKGLAVRPDKLRAGPTF